MRSILLLISMAAFTYVSAQQKSDGLQTKYLDSVTIVSYLHEPAIERLTGIHGLYNFSGKKNAVINLAGADADIANKTARQTFAKIPGIFVYDMDGAGNQINISSRGLDPHRGWEFNIRKDGILTNSDMYGYPASHYSMPFESIGRIELVRGTGSLQYGAQFGGMLNYISKQGDTSRPFSYETINTVGSYNFLSSYHAVGGKQGKLRYYAYVYKKSRDGYRQTESTKSGSQHFMLLYEPTETFSVKLEWSRSKYLYRLPGAMTDSMFHTDPTQSTRLRNYYSPDIHIPAITVTWKPASSTVLQFTSSAVLGTRNSVMFDNPTNIPDTIVAGTGAFNHRQVDIDNYNSYTNELRIVHRYKLAKKPAALVAGIQLMTNDLHRRQMGKGTTGSDYDLTLVEPGWGRDIHFKTKNVALFAEKTVEILDDLELNMGARIESGTTALSGLITYYPENEIPVTVKHHFPLFGAGLNYKPLTGMEWYAGLSQAYHPMLLKDLVPSSLYDKVDPAIKDADGYNAEIGFRGERSILKWDISAFILKYNDRFGTLAQLNDDGEFYTYRTNIGNSTSKGLEFFIQANWILSQRFGISVFSSTSFMDARYGDGVVKTGNTNTSVKGNKVESSPGILTRNGVTFKYLRTSVSLLHSYTGKTYADALNTENPAPITGATGLVPDYTLLDLNASIRIVRNVQLRLNVNNLTNKKYFTKRPMFYPGPGVWPSDERNANASVVLSL